MTSKKGITSLTLGVVLGVAIGLALDNIGMGIGIGIALGIAFGLVARRARSPGLTALSMVGHKTASGDVAETGINGR